MTGLETRIQSLEVEATYSVVGHSYRVDSRKGLMRLTGVIIGNQVLTFEIREEEARDLENQFVSEKWPQQG